MRKLAIAVLGLALSSATAQAEGLGLFGSIWTPDVGDKTLGVGLKLREGPGHFYLGGRATYYNRVEDAIGTTDLRVIPVDVTVGLQAEPLEEVNIYGGGGVSYFFLDAYDGSEEDEVGWLLEAGAELTITKHLSVFAEILWREIEGTHDDGDIDLDRVDIDLDGPVINLGIVLR